MSSTPTLKFNAADHPIKSVTIFKSSKAEIVRQFSLNLKALISCIKAGQTKVEIRGLSGSIDTDSVRVSGLGEARLCDVLCTIGVGKDMSYAPDSSSEIIRLLQVKKYALESEKRVREHEADLLVSYAKTLSGEHVPPTQMITFLESFVEHGRQNLNNITELNEKIIALDRQIERETEKSVSKKGNAQGEVTIIQSADNSRTVDLKLTYIVGNVSWTPTYELHAKTENGKPSSTMAFHYRARILQSTGEDWTNASLTLSTISSDTVAKRIPQLMPVKLRPRAASLSGGRLFGERPDRGFNVSNNYQQQQRPLFTNVDGVNGGGPSRGLLFGQANASPPQHQPFQPQPQAQPQLQAQPQPPPHPLFGAFGVNPRPAPSGAFSSAPAPSTSFGGFGTLTQGVTLPPQADEAFEEISATEVISEPTTFVNETPVAISFSITGESTIPSDGLEHQVSVSILAFEAKISYVAIPRIEPRCQIKNTSEYRLLAGPVSVILDDSYVSKTSIGDVSTGENFGCTLGDDAAMKVTYSRTARTVKSEAGSFSEAQNTTTYTTVITIENKHGFALSDVVVRDVVPTVDDKRAKVILRKPEGLADSKDGEEIVVGKGGQQVGKVAWEKQVDRKGGEKEGKFAWKASVKAKETVMLESQWELKAPADGTYWQESMAD
ncbi:hypothetical protein C0995_007132 [Termitomyces sp. Mi166|nr:hypothetical protein C0995_007132 [Termitomyces sp. Mi166\